jgi:hypothetical protein
MSNCYPFHYEVRFRLISQDADNNFKIQSYVKKCMDKNPLIARKKAFEIFNDYLSYPYQAGRIDKNKRGNYKIIKPTFVKEYLQRVEAKSKEEIKKREGEKPKDLFELALDLVSINSKVSEEFEKFKEDISVYLVISDIELKNKLFNETNIDQSYIDQINNEFVIHKVASYSFNEQSIIDDLEMVELELYNLLNIDVSKIVKEVYHYGLDYEESGEDRESGARRKILATPHFWESLDEYNETNSNYGYKDEAQEEISALDFKDIIEKGESHQVEFKPTLLYNFRTQKGGISVLYIIAKAICGFLNSNGGILFIGVKDSGEVQGLDYDYSLYDSENGRDRILLEIDSLIARYFGVSFKPLINASIEIINEKDVLVVIVEKSDKPVLLKNLRDNVMNKEMFVRMNASTHQLKDIQDIIDYLINNWGK